MSSGWSFPLDEAKQRCVCKFCRALPPLDKFVAVAVFY